MLQDLRKIYLIDLSRQCHCSQDISVLLPVPAVIRCTYWSSLSYANCEFVASVHRGNFFFHHLASPLVLLFCGCRSCSSNSSSLQNYLTTAFKMSELSSLGQLCTDPLQTACQLAHYHNLLHVQDCSILWGLQIWQFIIWRRRNAGKNEDWSCNCKGPRLCKQTKQMLLALTKIHFC